MKLNVLLLSVWLYCNAVWAQGPDFKGVPFGSSEASFQAAFPVYSCMPDRYGPAQRMCAAGRDVCNRERYGCGPNDFAASTYAGENVSLIAATFLDDKLSQILVSIEPRTFAAIVSGLTQKFGPATSSTTKPFQTVGGVKTTNELVVWKSPDFFVEASRYADSLDHGEVRISTPEYERVITRALELKGKARKKDM